MLTLRELASVITSTTAKTKEELPLLKLQRFGDQRTDKNCLRSDANVIEIFGIEGEHDAGTMSFTEATEALHKAKLRGIVYTSPSYVPGTKERWRVLLSTSGPLAPGSRTGLVARLNGVVGGMLAPAESFTLSQSFYYGSVDNNPNHQVRVLDGDFIDLRPDLDAGAIFKGKTVEAPGSAAAAGEREPSEPWEEHIVRILAGEPLRPSIRDLAAKLIKAGTDPAAVENILRGLMDRSAGLRDKRWQERYDDIPRAVASAEAKFAPEPAQDISQLWAKLKEAGKPAPPPPPAEDADANKIFVDNIDKKFANLDAWVPQAFPGVKYAATDTAIGIVLANIPAATDETEAALWLCKMLNGRNGVSGIARMILPQQLGWIPPGGGPTASIFSGTISAPPDNNKAFFNKVNATFTQDNFLTWKLKVFPDADPEWTLFMENHHTAIDTVLPHKDDPNSLAAALILCECCGVDPKLLGYSGPPQPAAAPAAKAQSQTVRAARSENADQAGLDLRNVN